MILADNKGMKQIILFLFFILIYFPAEGAPAISCKEAQSYEEISKSLDQNILASFTKVVSDEQLETTIETTTTETVGNKTVATKKSETTKKQPEFKASAVPSEGVPGICSFIFKTNPFTNPITEKDINTQNLLSLAFSRYGGDKNPDKKSSLINVFNEFVLPCKAFSAMASINNWQHDSVGGAAPAANGQAQPQVASGGCVKRGSFTADYKSCKTISGLMVAVGVSEMGMGTYQKVDMMNHSEKLTDDLNKSKDDLQVKSINAMKSNTEKESSQKNQQAMFQSAKGASLLGSIAGYITPKNAAKHCEGAYQGCCEYAVKSQYTGWFFSNQQMKDQALAMGVKAMGQAAMDKLMAEQLKKRAGMLGNLEKAVAENGSTDGFQDWQGNYCQTPQGQADAQCINRGNGSSVRPTMQGSSFEIGSLGGLGAGDTNALGGSNNAANGKKLAALDDIKKGLVDFDAAAKDGGSIGGSAAGFKAQGPLAAVSGGSGVGGASSGGAGKSSGDPSASSGARNSADSGPSTNVSRYGKGKGGTSWKRYDGTGRGGKDEEPANAFAGLFDQPSEDREIASSDEIAQQGSDLFQKISIRYEQVNDENRLLKQ